MNGEGVFAEDAKAEGGDPVGERRFFEVADAIDTEGDQVASEGHVAGGLAWVASASSQRRSEEGGEEDSAKDR